MTERLSSHQCVDETSARKNFESTISEGTTVFFDGPSGQMLSEIGRMNRSIEEFANNPNIPDDATLIVTADEAVSAGTVRQLVRADRSALLSELRKSSGLSNLVRVLSEGKVPEWFDCSRMLFGSGKDAIVIGLLLSSQEKRSGTLQLLNEAFGTGFDRDTSITARGRSMPLSEFMEEGAHLARKEFETKLREVRNSCEKAENLGDGHHITQEEIDFLDSTGQVKPIETR